MFCYFCFDRHAGAFKCRNDFTCQTEIPAFVLLQTSKLTGYYQSRDDGLTKCVRLFLIDISIGCLGNPLYFDFCKSLTPFGVLIS